MILRRDPLADLRPLLDRVYSYVAYRIGPGPDAEDVVGDTLERALRYRSSYDPRRGEPVTWLIGIARRCIADAAARSLVPVPEVDDVASPFRLDELTLDRIELRRAVAALEERDRELVGLRFGADLSAKQIGALLDMSPGAVGVAIHRALARLRAELEETAA